MGQVPDAMAAELGEAVVLGAPVTGVTRDGDRRGGAGRRRAPCRPGASCWRCRVRWRPASGSTRSLPADHALLIHQVPAGTEVKMVAIYDEPFWRHDGISGATVATDDDIEVTLDTCQPNHSQGVVAGYSAGPRARALAALGEAERRDVFVRHADHGASGLAPPPRSRCSSRTGRRSNGPVAAPWATSPPAS